MKTNTPVKLIKKEKPKVAGSTPEPTLEAAPAPDPRTWSKVVRSWISESQSQTRDESLAAFAGLFK